MIIRPVDENGDILPVLSSASLFRDREAIARLIQDRLELLTGDWWENTAWGNNIVEMLKEGRFTESNQQVLASYISSYIRNTPGVRELQNVSFSVTGSQFHYECVAGTEYGDESIVYDL